MTLTCDRVNLSRRPEVEHHASSDLLEALTFTEVYFQVFNIIFLPSEPTSSINAEFKSSILSLLAPFLASTSKKQQTSL